MGTAAVRRVPASRSVSPYVRLSHFPAAGRARATAPAATGATFTGDFGTGALRTEEISTRATGMASTEVPRGHSVPEGVGSTRSRGARRVGATLAPV